MHCLFGAQRRVACAAYGSQQHFDNTRGRVSQDPQGVGSAPGNADRRAPCYGVADLRIGASVGVHGRNFFLHDCDDFTRGLAPLRPSLCCLPEHNSSEH